MVVFHRHDGRRTVDRLHPYYPGCGEVRAQLFHGEFHVGGGGNDDLPPRRHLERIVSDVPVDADVKLVVDTIEIGHRSNVAVEPRIHDDQFDIRLPMERKRIAAANVPYIIHGHATFYHRGVSSPKRK